MHCSVELDTLEEFLIIVLLFNVHHLHGKEVGGGFLVEIFYRIS